MKVLEERLTYLFVVFCKDLLCLSYSILAQGLSFVRLHFLFPSLPLLVLSFISILFDTLISMFHLQLNSFDSQDAPILDLESLAYLHWRFCLIASFSLDVRL